MMTKSSNYIPLITFLKSSYDKKIEMEVIRMANKLNIKYKKETGADGYSIKEEFIFPEQFLIWYFEFYDKGLHG